MESRAICKFNGQLIGHRQAHPLKVMMSTWKTIQPSCLPPTDEKPMMTTWPRVSDRYMGSGAGARPARRRLRSRWICLRAGCPPVAHISANAFERERADAPMNVVRSVRTAVMASWFARHSSVSRQFPELRRRRDARRSRNRSPRRWSPGRWRAPARLRRPRRRSMSV